MDYLKICGFIPHCAEKLCIDLVHDLSNNISIDINESLNKIEEELINENNWLSSYKTDIEEIKDHVNKKSKEKAIDCIENFLNRKIRHLDLAKIIDLIQFDNSKITEKIRNKKVIMIFGISGAGKSTLLHYLGGSKMIKDKDIIYPEKSAEKKANPDLENVICKFSIKSETKNVIPVKITYFDEANEETIELIICDTPGFCDTNSPEIDIANSILLRNAINLCSAIKPVLLFDSSMGPRFQLLNKVSNVFVDMLNNRNLIQDSLIYMFNRFNEEKKDLKEKFKALLHDVNESRDECLKILLKDICDRELKDFIKLNLLDEKPNEILKILSDNRSYKYIENPYTHFRISHSEDSKYKFSQQIQQNFASIEHCLKLNKININLAEYKANQVLAIMELLEVESSVYREINSLIIRLDENLTEFLEKKSSTYFELFDKEIPITDYEVKINYVYAMNSAISIDRILNKFLPVDKQCDNLSKMVVELNQRLISASDHIKSTSVENGYELIKNKLTKIKDWMYISRNFDDNEVLEKFRIEIKEIYTKSCKLLLTNFEKYIDQKSDDIINKTCINEVINDLDTIKGFNELAKNDENFKIHIFYDQLLEKLFNSFKLKLNANNLKEEISSTQDKTAIDEIFKKFDSNDLYFRIMLSNSKISNHVPIERILELYEHFCKSINQFFETELKSKYKESLEGIHDDSNDLDQQLYIFYIFKNSSNLNFIIHSYSELIKLTMQQIESFRIEAINSFERVLGIKNEWDSNSTMLIISSLTSLDDFKWFEFYKPRFVNDCWRKIEKAIKQSFCKLSSDAFDLKIDLKNLDDLKSMNVIISKIARLEKIFEEKKIFSDELKEIINGEKQKALKGVKNVFTKIDEYLNKTEKKFNYDFVDKSLSFFEKYEETMDERFVQIEASEETKNRVVKFLEDHFNSVRNEINNFFDKMNSNESNLETLKIDSTYECVVKCKKLENYKTFDNFVDANQLFNSFLIRLKNLHSSMEQSFESLRGPENRNEFRNLLEKCQVMRLFDEFLNPHGTSSHSFSNLYDAYSAELSRTTLELTDVCENYIKEGKYYELKIQFDRFDKTRDIKRLNNLKQTLASSLLDLLENKIEVNLQEYINHLNKENLIDKEASKTELDLKNYLARFKKAKNHLSFFIYPNEPMEIKEKRIIKLSKDCFNQKRDKIVELMRKFEIKKAEKEKLILIESNFISLSLDDPELNKIFDKLDEFIQIQSENFTDVFKSLKNLETPCLKDNYETAIKFFDEDSSLIKALESHIVKLFEKELQSAAENAKIYENVDSNKHFQYCKRIAENYIPEKIRQNSINKLIETYIKKIESVILYNKLCSILNDNKKQKTFKIDYEYFENLLNDLTAKNDHESIQIVSSIILDKVNKLVQYFETVEYDKSKPSDSIDNNFKLEFYEKIYNKFKDKIHELKGVLEKRYVPKVNQILNQTYIYISSSLKNPHFDYKLVKENLEFLISFKDFCQREQLVCLNIEEKLMKKLSNYLNDLIDNYKKKFNEIKNNLFQDLLFIKQLFKISCLLDELKLVTTPCLNIETIKYEVETGLENLLNQLDKTSLIQNSFGKQSSDYETFWRYFFENLNQAKMCHDYFKEYKLSQSILENYNNLLNKVESFISDCYSKGKNNINNLLKNKQEILEIDPTKLQSFLNCFYNLKSILKSLKDNSLNKSMLKIANPNFEDEWNQLIIDECDNYLNSIENKNIKDAAVLLCNVKEIEKNFVFFGNSLKDKLKNSIEKWIKSNGGFTKIGQLGLELKNLNENGQIILDQEKIFESFERSLFYKKIKDRDIKIILNELEEKNEKKINRKILNDFYTTFDSEFKELIKKYKYIDPITKSYDLSSISTNITNLALDNKFNWTSKSWSLKPKSISKLTANLFALYSLDNSLQTISLGSSSSDSIEQDYLFQAHPAQVLSIALMLNIGQKDSNATGLKNCLIQIGTGEGKSITLAITATILALLGFNVYCVCYSKYLSERDYSMFYSLFERLNLTKNIKYDTFYEICEQMINKNGDLRTISESFIKKGEIKLENDFKKMTIKPKILLIDEVDVFFSKDFYGSQYLPALSLKQKCIDELLDFIWSTYCKQKENLKFEYVKNSDSYKNVCKEFANWIDLIDSAVHTILNDIKTFESIDHKVSNDQIGYIENDTISFNIKYAYKTIFAYYLHKQSGSISDSSLNKNKSLLVKLGTYSLAEIPKSDFIYILGVTGTLEHLISGENAQKEIIENEYAIKSHIIMPSVYGRSNFVFNSKSEVYIVNEENYYRKLNEEIKNHIDRERSVFVFFENINDLKKFQKWPDYLFQFQTEVLSEETKDEEKKRLINLAASSSKVTLITRAFGRGTDFKVYDKKVKDEGVHIIQTFLSNEKSEEIQIKGRTARQGEKGTFSMIIQLKDLGKYNIEKDIINNNLNNNEYYSVLDSKRNDHFNNCFKETIEKTKNLKTKHDQSVEFLNNLVIKEANKVKDYIIKQNSYSNNCLDSNKKILILMDATGSMQGLIDKTKSSIEIMFKRVFEILNLKKTNKTFEIKITVYRNYNAPLNKILESSNWESKSENLSQFLGKIKAEYGLGNEAIELALWQANQESDLSEIILIGDASPNTKEQIKSNRSQYYLSANKFSETYYEDELEKLKKKCIKINTFYLKNQEKLKKDFQNIASSPNDCKYLDINLENSSQMLIDLYCEQILNSFGDQTLVEAYRTHRFE